MLEQHAPLPAACSPALSHSCSECQQGCSNKQVAYFSINMHKACFNTQRLKQPHSFLQFSAFVTDWLLKLGVSPNSICQALIFFSLLPAKLEINNFCFILSLAYHRYQQGWTTAQAESFREVRASEGGHKAAARDP